MLPNEVPVNFKVRPKLWLVSPFAVVLVFGLFHLPWGAESAPAWVQAVGSVLAILVAIWIASHQARMQREVLKNIEAEQLKKIVGVSRYLGNISCSALDAMKAQDIDLRVLDRFARALTNGSQLLQEVSYERIPNIEAALGWLELRLSVVDLQEILVTASRDDNFSGELLTRADIACGWIENAVDRILKGAKEYFPGLDWT